MTPIPTGNDEFVRKISKDSNSRRKKFNLVNVNEKKKVRVGKSCFSTETSEKPSGPLRNRKRRALMVQRIRNEAADAA